MKEIQVSNTTVYDTSDIVEIARVLHPELTDLKIRYRNSPGSDGEYAKREGSRYDRYRSFSKVEVSIIRPSAIKVNALVWLAEQAEPELEEKLVVPSKVKNDLIAALCQTNLWLTPEEEELLEECRSKAGAMEIRMHRKAKGRKAAALISLKAKVKGREDNISYEKDMLASLELQIGWRKERLKGYEESLIELKAKLAKKQAAAKSV